MKKQAYRIIAILLSVLLLCSATACDTQSPASPQPQTKTPVAVDPPVVEDPIQPDEPEQPVPELPELKAEDFSGTYWKAVRYREGDNTTVFPLTGQHPNTLLELDVFFYEDGTACVREREGDVYRVGDFGLTVEGTWEVAQQQILLNVSEDRVVTFGYEHLENTEPMLTLPYGNGTVLFSNKPQPEGGELYISADLEGEWQLQAYEVEGDYVAVTADDPAQTLSFTSDGKGRLLADYRKQAGEYSDAIVMEAMAVQRKMIQEDYPLFQENGNDVWYVELDTEGQPKTSALMNTESFRLTLLDRDTLMLHYIGETDAEPYLIAVCYVYSRI